MRGRPGLIMLSALLITLAACGPPPSDPGGAGSADAPGGQAQRFALFDGGQITVGDLSISAGDFGLAQYIADDQVTRTGQTCVLWVFVRGREDLNHPERVYPGKIVRVAGYRIQVDGIEMGRDQRYAVRLTVVRPPTPPQP